MRRGILSGGSLSSGGQECPPSRVGQECPPSHVDGSIRPRMWTGVSNCRRGLGGFNSNGADFEFGGLGDGVVAGSGEDVDGDIGEREGGEDGALG